MLKAINILASLALFLLLRKLIWCLRWLWCWKHGPGDPAAHRLAAQSGRRAV